MNKNVLNVPINSSINFKKLDGKKIVTATQYQLLINLNLTLLEYDKNANLVTLLAEDYDIEERVINIKIKKGVKTIGGHEIMAKDAEVSLKRLIMNNNGSHSRLSDLLCREEINKVSNKCPGISSQGYELKITAQKKSYIPFILSLLTNADNVILPLSALSSSLSDSEILNFKETSGPYYIDNDKLTDEHVEKFKLSLNPKHFLYEKNLASEVNYSHGDLNNVLKGEYNYIHSVVGLSLNTIKDAEAKNSIFTLHQTLPIKNTIIFSTQKGRKIFSSSELIIYGLKIKDFLLNSKEYYPNIVQNQTSYFPSESEGNLRDDQFSKITKIYDELKNFTGKATNKIRVGVYKALFDKYKIAFHNMKDIEIILVNSSPLDKNKEEVDLYITAMDSSFTTRISEFLM
jgi:hypothetical protein